MVEENGVVKIGQHGGSHLGRKEVQGCQCWAAFNKFLIKLFAAFGTRVAHHPLYFIIIPVIITLFLITGGFWINILDDPIKLFVPDTSPFLKERAILESHFPINYSHFFSPSRFTQFEGHSRIIITAKDGGSIIRDYLWNEIIDLNYKIRNISIEEDGQVYNYDDLCGRFDGECSENTALNIYDSVGEIANGSAPLTWPVTIFPYVLPQFLGGYEVNETEGTIHDPKAILLAYFTIIKPEDMLRRTLAWELKLIDLLKDVKYKNIKISFYASRSLGDELKVKMDSSLPYAPLTGFIMIVSCMTLLWMKDCVRSKPLIGVVGITSAFMASGAAFGFLMYIGVIYTRLNIVAVFLVLGIGVDDIFVAISSWQKTNPKDSVPTRMAHTYADAAVSVTITSLTNCLSFAVGTTTPIIIVQNFCLYCAVTIIFAYLWFVTFCGGFLALAGYMEEKRMHSLFFVKIEPTNKAPDKRGFWKKICFSSDLVENDADPSVPVPPHAISVFFRDKIGNLLYNKAFRVFAVVTVIAYLIGAIYGCMKLKQGLYRYRMARDDSYLNDFHHDDNTYFRALPYTIQIVISGNVTYSDPETQEQILNLLDTFEATKYGSESIFTQAWLRGFLRQFRREETWQASVTDETSLIKLLREQYFVNPSNEEILDLDFNDNFTTIEASRYIVQVANVTDIYDDVVMMNLYREIGANSSFNVTVFHVLFGLFDQHSLLRPLAIQSIVIAAVIVMLVSLLFIPNIHGSIAIAFSIISIAAGVVGYMGFWDINLDQVSVGSIFMCIGFSVDFSAHITYTYLSSHEPTSEGKLRASLFGLGLPIMQGGITTILSLVTFLMIPGYGYRTFFKTIFLVTIFAVYYSIVFIPLFLNFLQYIGDKCNGSDDKETVSGLNYQRKSGSFKKDVGIPHLSNGVTKPEGNNSTKLNSEYHSKSIHSKTNGVNQSSNNSLNSTNGTNISLSNGNNSSETNGGIVNKAFTE